MFAVTHSIISINIIDDLKKKHNIDINNPSFIWGNIKPDIVKTYIKDRHYRDESIDSVTKRIVEMSNINPTDINSKTKIREFLVRLGIIAHYLSDYFCLPHNNRWRFFEGYTKEHILYETKLESASKQFNMIPPSTMKDLKLFEEEEAKVLLKEVDEMYSKKQSFLNDIAFAVNVCVHIIKTIIFKIFNQTKKIIF